LWLGDPRRVSSRLRHDQEPSALAGIPQEGNLMNAVRVYQLSDLLKIAVETPMFQNGLGFFIFPFQSLSVVKDSSVP
jgi:hypothetical protein